MNDITNLYFNNYQKLLKIVNIKKLREIGKLKYISKSINSMALNVSFIESVDENYLISLSHNYIENDDIIYDPKITIKIDSKNKIIEALSYQDRYLIQDVYFIKNGKKYQDFNSKTSLNKFLGTWLSTLIREGYRIIKD